MNVETDRVPHGHSSLERLGRWQRRPEVKRITSQYADWVNTDAGVRTMTQLSGLAVLRLAQKLSRSEYKAEVGRLAKSAKLPTKHVRVLARSAEEMVRCMLIGSGQLRRAVEAAAA